MRDYWILHIFNEKPWYLFCDTTVIWHQTAQRKLLSNGWYKSEWAAKTDTLKTKILHFHLNVKMSTLFLQGEKYVIYKVINIIMKTSLVKILKD